MDPETDQSITIQGVCWSTANSKVVVWASRFGFLGQEYGVRLRMIGPRNGYRATLFLNPEKAEELGHALIEVAHRAKENNEKTTT